MFRLENKVALITGAGQGMGKTHALTLASQGARVVVTDINAKTAEAVAQEIKAKGGETLFFKMDVTDCTEINKVIAESVRFFSQLDILVNNAGIFFTKAALEMTEEDWDKMLNVNLKGQFFCAKRAAEEMTKNKWGRIINISSIASGGGGIGETKAAHYAASKAGIIGVTKSLAIELAYFGITVNAIAPTLVADTSIISSIPHNVINERIGRIPLKRIGRPDEISSVVAFLASEEASYITGTTIYVDGGRLAT